MDCWGTYEHFYTVLDNHAHAESQLLMGVGGVYQEESGLVHDERCLALCYSLSAPRLQFQRIPRAHLVEMGRRVPHNDFGICRGWLTETDDEY